MVDRPTQTKTRGCVARVLRATIRGTLRMLVVVFISLLLYVRTDDFQARSTSIVIGIVEEATGEKLEIDRLDVGIFPPRAQARRIRLFHEPTQEDILSADFVDIPVAFSWGHIEAGVVVINQPKITVHVEEDGTLREFQDRPHPQGPRDPIKRLPIQNLAVRNASFSLIHSRGEVTLSELDSTPTSPYHHDIHGQLFVRFDDLDVTAPVDLLSVELGPERVRVPDLRFVSDPLSINGLIEFPLDDEIDVRLSAHLLLPKLNDALVTPRELFGEVYLDLGMTGKINAPSLTINAFGEGLGVNIPGTHTPLLHHRFGDVSIAARATKEAVIIDDLHADWSNGTIQATARIDPNTLTLEDARIVGDRISLRELLINVDSAPNPWIDMITDAELEVSGPLKPLHLTGDFDLAVADLQVKSGPVQLGSSRPMLAIPSAFALGTLTLDSTHIVLNATTIQGPQTQAAATVDIGFKPRGPLDIQANIYHADLSDFQPLGGTELGGTGQIKGRLSGPFNQLRFEGTGDLQQFSVLGIPFADHLLAPVFTSDMKSIELLGAVATTGKTTYTGDFRFDFRSPLRMDTDLAISDGRIEDITSIFLPLPGLTGKMNGTLSLHGPIFALDGLGAFDFTDLQLWGESFDTGRGHGVMDKGHFTLEPLTVQRGDQRISLAGTIQEGWALDMVATTHNLTVESLDHIAPLNYPITGDLSAQVRLNNTLFSPEPHGQIVLQHALYAGAPLSDSVVTFTTEDGVMNIQGVGLDDTINISGTFGLWDTRPYNLHTQLTSFPAHLLHPVAANGESIRAVGSGTVDFVGTLEHPRGRTINGELHAVTLQWSDHTLTNINPWTYTQHGDAYELKNFDLRGTGTEVSLSAKGEEELLMDGNGKLDLDLLRAIVPGLDRAEGSAAVMLHATGSAPDIHTEVNVSIDGELLRHRAVPITFEDIYAELSLTEDLLQLKKLLGKVGGGTITGSGRIDAASWRPTRFDLEAELVDAQVQWVDSLPPAIGDATLRFDGPVRALLLEGDVTIKEMLFTDRIDWEDSVVEYRGNVVVGSNQVFDEDPWFNLNVHIGADKTIRLRNNLAEGTISADLTVIGDTNRPGLMGWVRVDDAVVFLQDRSFQVDRGELNYNDPWTWDPDINFDLVTDISSRNQRYRVSYQVSGPFSNWHTNTRSDPGLPQADINALLWFGVTTEELEQSGQLPTAVAQGVADLLLTDLFSSTQANELGEVPELLFDRIDVATGVNGRGEYSAEPRLIVQKRIDELGDVNFTWEFNLGRPEDNFVRMEKRVGGVWSIAGWYATMQRNRVLPIGGAYGVDFTARWEAD